MLTNKDISITCLLLVSFLAQAIILTAIPFLANIGGEVAYWSVFALVFAFGIFNGTCLAKLYYIAAMFPPKYISSLVIGMGATSIICNVLRIVTLAVWPADKKATNEFVGSLALFAVAIIIKLLNAVSYLYLTKSQFAR